MRKPKSRNRTFQSHGAGKGSADRTTDDKAFRRNFDAINWGNKITNYYEQSWRWNKADNIGDWDYLRSK